MMADIDLLLKLFIPVVAVAVVSLVGVRRGHTGRWLLAGAALYAVLVGADRRLNGALAGPTTGRVRAVVERSAKRVLEAGGRLEEPADVALWSGPKPRAPLLDAVAVAWPAGTPAELESVARAALAAEPGRPPLGALRLALRESWLEGAELDRAQAALEVDGTLEELAAREPPYCWADHWLVRRALGQLPEALRQRDPTVVWGDVLELDAVDAADEADLAAWLALRARGGAGDALTPAEEAALGFEAHADRALRWRGVPFVAWRLEAIGATAVAALLALGAWRGARRGDRASGVR